MADEAPDERDLQHKLANAEQQKRALKGMLDKAADELEEIVEADCEDEAKEEALATAAKLRRAASL
jgi:hypothetical protein